MLECHFSGTTLVEQIVSSHSLITGAGELPFVDQFGRLLNEGLTEINKDNILEFRENYLRKLKNCLTVMVLLQIK